MRKSCYNSLPVSRDYSKYSFLIGNLELSVRKLALVCQSCFLIENNHSRIDNCCQFIKVSAVNILINFLSFVTFKISAVLFLFLCCLSIVLY